LNDKLVGVTTANAPVLVSGAVLEQQLSPNAASCHFMTRDAQVEGKLIEVEKLIRRRSYNVAIREARQVRFDDSDLASTYDLMINEKIARSGETLLKLGVVTVRPPGQQEMTQRRGLWLAWPRGDR
jgi:hypothetical protein